MRDNGPVTNIEHVVPENTFLVSRTDPHGHIISANDGFVAISGFTRDELVGKPHSLVRHPDMPPVAFADLWATISSGRCWVGTVKNRRKDGGHYWVRAAVAPVMRDGAVTAYVSVRVRPSDAEKRAAEAAYAAARAGAGANLHRGRLRPSAVRAMLDTIGGRVALAVLPAVACTIAGIVLAWSGAGTAAAGCGAVALVCGLAAALYARARVMARIGQLGDQLDRLARGEEVALDLDRGDELQDLTLSIASLQTHLKAASLDLAESHRGVVAAFDAQIGPVLHDLNEVVRQLGGASSAQGGLAEEVAACARSVAAATTELGSSIAEISRQASQADRLAGEARERTSGGLDAARRLGVTAAEIGEVARSIEAIASKTNLLALNATIEAAAAGEYGRSFAVVASEVKQLAGQARTATADISKRLTAVQTDAAAINEAMQGIVGATGNLAQATASIAAAVEQQTAVTNELSSNSNNLAESARQAGASAQAVGGVATRVTEVDGSLVKAVSVFRSEG